MADAPVLKAQIRTNAGSRDALRLRKKGIIPAVVYGHKEAPESVTVTLEDLQIAIRAHSRMLTLDSGSKKQGVLIQSVQYCHLHKDILHVDFLRASETDLIRVTVPIELRGTAAGIRAGGVLLQPLHSIHVECTVAARPDAIRVKLDDLQVGQAIHVRELTIPAGVKVLDNPEALVVQIKLPSAEPAPSALPIEGAVEPEVITKKKEKPEEGEEG